MSPTLTASRALAVTGTEAANRQRKPTCRVGSQMLLVEEHLVLPEIAPPEIFCLRWRTDPASACSRRPGSSALTCQPAHFLLPLLCTLYPPQFPLLPHASKFASDRMRGWKTHEVAEPPAIGIRSRNSAPNSSRTSRPENPVRGDRQSVMPGGPETQIVTIKARHSAPRW